MKVFLSWSGDRSKALATALSTWLTDVIQSVVPWMSDHDIQAGARWGGDLDSELEQSNFGVLCLTSDNLEKPWLLFEAGSLAKSISAARVVPYRLDVSATDVKPPLSQFQGVDATKEGTLKLVRSINDSAQEPMPPDRVERSFEKYWPDLESRIQAAKLQPGGEVSMRDEVDYLKEILELVRQLPKDRLSFDEAASRACSFAIRERIKEGETRLQSIFEKGHNPGNDPEFQREQSSMDDLRKALYVVHSLSRGPR
jgi:hypothetical protein